MLPFVRMLEFGNIRPEPKVIKALSTSDVNPTVLVLKEDGKLYGAGWNTNNLFGTNTLVQNEVPVWTELRNDVVNFWCSSYGTLVLTNTNKWFFSGFNAVITIGGSGNTTTWTDVSSKFAIFTTPTAINDIQLDGFGISVLYGTFLYYSGLNFDYSMGSGGQKATFTLVLSAVKKLAMGPRTSLAVLTNGNLMGTGWNGYGMLGNGSVTQLTTWTNIRTQVQDVMLSNRNSHILTSTGVLMGSGFQLDGALGNGVSSNAYILTYANISTPGTTAKLYNSPDSSSSISISGVMYNGGKFYRSGQNNYGAIGNNNGRVNVSAFTAATGPTLLEPINVTSRPTGTLILGADNEIYYYGLNFKASGVVGDYVLTLTQISKP